MGASWLRRTNKKAFSFKKKIFTGTSLFYLIRCFFFLFYAFVLIVKLKLLYYNRVSHQIDLTRDVKILIDGGTRLKSKKRNASWPLRLKQGIGSFLVGGDITLNRISQFKYLSTRFIRYYISQSWLKDSLYELKIVHNLKFTIYCNSAVWVWSSVCDKTRANSDKEKFMVFKNKILRKIHKPVRASESEEW